MNRRKLLSFGVSMPIALMAQGVVEPINDETKYHYLLRCPKFTEWSYIQFTEAEIKEHIYDIFRSDIEKKHLITAGLVITASDLSPRLCKNPKIPMKHMFADEIVSYASNVFNEYKKYKTT
jgi:hypothetical protein